MTGQCFVVRMNLTVPALKDQRSHGLGIVPPNVAGYRPEKLEGGDHAFEDCLGTLERERQHERGVGVGPSRHDEWDEPAALGEIDVDVTEISLKPVARKMCKWNKRFLVPMSVAS